jgi:YHS domain-containing protein
MKQRSILSFFAALPLVFGACSKTEKPAVSTDTKPAGDYPLTTCVVSGEELGGMGEPVTYDYKGTTVKFCCKDCIPKFEKEPDRYLGKLK